MSTVLRKQPNESIIYTMDFSNNLECEEIITNITSITVDPNTTNLLCVLQTFSDKKVQFRASQGVNKTSYKVTIVIETSLGNTREGEGILLVTNI